MGKASDAYHHAKIMIQMSVVARGGVSAMENFVVCHFDEFSVAGGDGEFEKVIKVSALEILSSSGMRCGHHGEFTQALRDETSPYAVSLENHHVAL